MMNILMDKKIILFLALVLFFLNVFCWQEVFSLQTNNVLKVVYLDVGQGDSEFIETPEGHQILIDGGPTSAVVGKLNSLMPFWDKTIDVVILTHPEKDHMAGILDVLQRYKVEYFLWSGVYKDNAENGKLAQLLENAQKPESNYLAGITRMPSTKVVAVSAGDQIKVGNAIIDILYPFENLEGQKLKDTVSANETGIVNRLIYGDTSFLFVGDIDSKIEKNIVNSEENIKCNVLKVAHHGSKYSTSNLFLEAVLPKYAVIEVGKNSYGHPTEEVLNRLANFGIQIKRTDKDGDIKFLSDGKNIQIK